MPQTQTKQDLIDLAIEYGLVTSTADFNSKSERVQNYILHQMGLVR